MKTSEKEWWIHSYFLNLKRGSSLSPTEIGIDLFKKPYSKASSYVNVAIKNMVSRGILNSVGPGRYRLSEII